VVSPVTDSLRVAEALARDFAATAVERDRRGGTPKQERDALRSSGLLALVVPSRLGGLGADWATTMRAVRTIARADGSVAHVFGFQHLLLATVRLFGSAAQFDAWATKTVEKRLFWGNALNPLDRRAVLERKGAGGRLNGQKSFCSGARDADALIVSAIDSATGNLVVAAVPADRPGISARDDWDNMGQRQTDSGTVVFEDVAVSPDEILATPGPLGSTFATLRPLVAQLSLCNVYQGIAEGAVGEAVSLARERRPWFASGVDRIADDPYVLATFGDLHADVEAGRLVTDAAATRIDESWAREDDLTPAERGRAAIAVAAAKVTTTRVGLDVTSRIFETTGARATVARLGLDRYWRNVRTHTLHDPVDYKRRDLGRWLLADEWPAPSFYS
jgi:alkylation response protein AidB-like acyl-CoA dehydrogenase